jgi:Fur family transcriptional regulator, ferric uptake regulator
MERGQIATDSERLVRALDRAGHRLTGPRRAVAELIARRDGYFTAADLVADAHEQRLGIGRATIFRSIELLSGAGLLERIDLMTGRHVYVVCEPAGHHHHVICSRCARSTEIGDIGLSELARDVSRRTGYRVDEHRLELFGLCPACQRATAHA